ncbi:MAG: hypothetical protein FWD63_04200 [Propionibacteriaceae bacterium]|nr:hypothetical protein [Propionibacteriaceae bacterium]
MAMSEDDYRASHPDDPNVDKAKKPLFVQNSTGMGFHPASALGWVILLAIIAVIVVIVVLFRTGTI